MSSTHWLWVPSPPHPSIQAAPQDLSSSLWRCYRTIIWKSTMAWLVGVAVSTTDSDSVDGGSIPSRAFLFFLTAWANGTWKHVPCNGILPALPHTPAPIHSSTNPRPVTSQHCWSELQKTLVRRLTRSRRAAWQEQVQLEIIQSQRHVAAGQQEGGHSGW